MIASHEQSFQNSFGAMMTLRISIQREPTSHRRLPRNLFLHVCHANRYTSLFTALSQIVECTASTFDHVVQRHGSHPKLQAHSNAHVDHLGRYSHVFRQEALV